MTYRDVIRSAIKRRVAHPHDLTDAEDAAGADPDFSFAPLPRIDLRRYGLSEDASGATNTAAIETAVDVAAEMGGAVLVAPPGDFTIDPTTVATNYALIEGQGRGATIWRFNPSSPAVAFTFSNGGDSILRSGIRECGFASNNTVTKTAILINDGRHCVIERCQIASGNWQGSGSIGVRTYGREFLTFRECDIQCARPYLVSHNPNYPTIHVDMSEVNSIQFATTESTGKNVEVEDGVEISNWRFVNCNFALGKYGFYWNDTTTTIASFQLAFVNCRTEQAQDSSGFSVYVASTAQNLQDLYFESCHFAPDYGGVYCRKVQRVTLNNCTFVGGAGITNLDITFETLTELRLHNTLVQKDSTITLTNGVMVESSPFSTATTAMARNAVYRYDEGAVISQKPARRYNDEHFWSYTGTIANNGQVSTPFTRTAYTAATISVTAYSATGPIHATGTAGWTKDGTTTKHGGSANFVTTLTASSLNVLDGGSGLIVLSTLGQTVTVVIDVVGVV